MLEPRDQKLIQKYTLLPLLARDCFLSAILLLVVSLLLTAADSVFLYQRDAYLPGIVLGFGLAVVLGAVSIYCLVAERRRPCDPAWLDLCERTLRAGPFAPNAGPDLPPRVVAQFHEVPVPSAAAVLLGLILLPPAMLLSLYLPHYRAGARRMEAQQQTASAAMEAIRQSMEEAGCEDVWCDDPFDYYSEYGYLVSAGLYDTYGPEEATVNLNVTNEGKVDSISYTIGVDVTKTNQENLDRALTELERLNGLVRRAPMELEGGDLLTADLMPEGFAEEFLAGSLYEDVYGWEEWEDTHLSANYSTYPEEEYDEYSRSYFWFRVEYADPDYGY